VTSTSQPRSLALVLLAFLAVVTLPFAASANHSWNGYHWARTRNPFTVPLGDNLSPSWKPYLTTISSDWSKSTVLDTTIVAGRSTSSRCSATSGRVEVCNGNYGQNGWLGLASIRTSGSHITQGTVRVNDTYFAMAKYNNATEKQHVLCQEVGHTFGLDHQDESGISLNTCMDYYHNTSNADTQSTAPNQHDYEELVTIYSHLDSTTTIGATPATGASATVATPAEWGRLMRTSSNGRASIYVREFAGGTRIFTFVNWAK
jgi:hypothetical protein